MGAKTWMLVLGPSNMRERLADYPPLDREASTAAVARLFPKLKTAPLEDRTLSWTCPPDDELCAGVYNGVTVLAGKEFGIDHPSKLESRFTQGSEVAVFHAMHSAVDWFAMAKWSSGALERSLSLAPDNGIVEDIGTRLSFELPYWNGQHPAVDPDDEDEDTPYPFPFHPLELGEEALRSFFGYQLEGYVSNSLLDAERFPLLRFKRKKSFFGF